MSERANSHQFAEDDHLSIGVQLFAKALQARYFLKGINPLDITVDDFLKGIGDLIRETSATPITDQPSDEVERRLNLLRGKPQPFYWQMLDQVPQIAVVIFDNDPAIVAKVTVRLRHISQADLAPRMQMPVNAAIPSVLQRMGMLPNR